MAIIFFYNAKTFVFVCPLESCIFDTY